MSIEVYLLRYKEFTLDKMRFVRFLNFLRT